MKGRQNVLRGASQDELNDKLGAVAEAFGTDWLEGAGESPVQMLWNRKDALATNELLNFGDAIQRLQAESPTWLKGQIDTIRSRDEGNAAGAIFEILGLNLFSRENCKVVPAPENMPGFDGTLLLSDGSRIVVSIKNHGMSTYEREFLYRARNIDEQFQEALRAASLNGIELRVLTQVNLDTSLWSTLLDDIAACVSQYESGAKDRELDRPYNIVLKPLDTADFALSAHELSSGVLVLSPLHKNEQDKFVEDIRKGCANLLNHTKEEPGDVCRMILLRLSATASVQNCREWAEWYFSEYPDDMLDLIMLYQCSVVTDTSADTSVIAHHFCTATGPRFNTWRRREDGSLRQLPALGVLVGQIAAEQPKMVLQGAGAALDMSQYYNYQRTDIFKLADLAAGPVNGTLSNPAPGVAIHLVVENNDKHTVLKMVTGRDKTLLLLR